MLVAHCLADEIKVLPTAFSGVCLLRNILVIRWYHKVFQVKDTSLYDVLYDVAGIQSQKHLVPIGRPSRDVDQPFAVELI